MPPATMTPNRRFLLEALGMGLELGCITPEDVLQNVTPEILAHHLPVAIKARLLQASLDAERLTPAVIVEAVGVEALVEHTPMPVLWSCIRAGALRQLGTMAGDVADELANRPLVGNGNGAGHAPDDLALKPPKSARISGSRASARVSSLSPRSRVLGRREDSVADGLGRGEPAPEPPMDFEVVDETDVRIKSDPVQILSRGDEETRPGSKS